MGLAYAFKEWAVICRALAEGKQALILRKGGIAETAGEFAVEHTRFWLFPTFVHQQRAGIRPEAATLLEKAEAAKPPAGTIYLSHWAEVTGVYRIRDLTPALLLAHLHFWSEETVRKRFAYREPGINALAVRIYRATAAHTITDTAHYQGCKSWVDLGRDLPAADATPVLNETDFDAIVNTIDRILLPTALV